MTLHRLTPIRVLIAVLAAVLALGALQAPANAAKGRDLSVSASSSAVIVGKSVTFKGILTKSPKGSAVVVQRKSGKQWVTAKTAKTATASGAYAVKVTVPSTAGNYSYRAFAAKKGNLGAATSATVHVSALTQVTATIKANPTRLNAGSSATMSGTVKPFVASTVVSFQKLVGNTWTSTGVTTALSKKGTYSKAVQVKTGALYRVSVPRVGLKAAANSTAAGVVTDPVITNTSLPGGTRGQPYSAQLTQVGSNPGTWGISPALPAGLSLNASTGKITGTPTGLSNASYTVSFAQPLLTTATKRLTLTVTAPVPPTISTTSLPDGQRGTAYTTTLTASGNPAGTWTASPLPAGLSVNATTGVISGTPTAAATTQVVIGFTQTASGLAATPKTLPLVVKLPPPPTISTTSLPAGVKGTAYTTTLTAAGNPAGTWTASPLPAGLSVNATTGVISGTPTAAATTQVVIGFTQTATGIAATPKTLALVVNPPPPPSIVTTSLPNAVVNKAYSYALQVSGNTAGTWSLKSGSLPFGIKLNASTGVISGTALFVTSKTVSIGFVNADGTATPVTLVLKVVAATP